MRTDLVARTRADCGRPSAPKLALPLWILAGLSGILTAFLTVGWLQRWNRPWRNDFAPFYAAGRLVARGRLSLAYSNPHVYEVEALLAHGRHAVRLPFPYPPYVAAFFGLLSRLPLQAAYDIWTGLNLVAYAVSAILVLRLVQGRARLVAGLSLLGCLPLVISTVQGENAGLLTLGMTLLAVGMTSYRGRSTSQSLSEPLSRGWPPAMVGVGILLLSAKPQLLLLPALILLIRHRPSEVVASASALMAAGLVGIVSGGVSGYVAFIALLRQAMHWSTQFHWGAASNYSLLAQLHGWLGYGNVATAIWLLGSVAVMAVYVKRGTVNLPLTLPLLTCLLANHLLFHDLAIIFPGLALAVAEYVGTPSTGQTSVIYALGLMSLLVTPWFDPALYGLIHLHLVVLSCTATLAIALWVGAGGTYSRTMDGYRARQLRGTWKLFARPRWASASGSATRSTS